METKEKIFIGAKSFNNEQIKLTLPTYEIIKNQIEEIRESAKIGNSNKRTQYNNTIGIFGERGTGKTSAAYTIIEELEKRNQDIILPIIEPDTYGDSTTILGVILKFLKDQMDEIFKGFKKENNKDKFPEFFKNCCFVENNKLVQSYNEILEYFCYKDNSYRNLIINNYTDMQSYKEKYSFVLAPDQSFAIKIKAFIDQLIKLKKELNGDDEEPLIIILIDDIDLKTNKCKELAEAVMAYTCHPNIVCFLLGDYEILKEALGLALLKEEKLLFSGKDELEGLFSQDMNLVKRKAGLANEYLKKILPPAFRHNVIKWNNENIPNFYFENREKSLKYLLEDMLGENNIFYKRVKNKNESEEGEINNKRDEIIFNESYEIFDNTARGIVNIYYYLYNYKNKIENENIDAFSIKKSLIDTIINSSSFLIGYQKKIYDEFIIWGNNEENTKLNFENLYKIEVENKNEVEFLNKMFILLDLTRELLGKSNESKEYIDKKNIYIQKIFRQYDYIKMEGNEKITEKGYETTSWKGDKAIFKELSYNTDFQVALSFISKIKDKEFHEDDGNHFKLKYEEQIYLYEVISNLILEVYGDKLLEDLYRNKKMFSKSLELIENISLEEKDYNSLRFKLNYNFSGMNCIGDYIPRSMSHKVLINYDNIIFNTILNGSSIDNQKTNNSEPRIKRIKSLKNSSLTKEQKGKLKKSIEDEINEIFEKVKKTLEKTDNNNISIDIAKLDNILEYKSGNNGYSILRNDIKRKLKENINLKDYSYIVAALRFHLYESTSYYGLKEAREALSCIETTSNINIGEDKNNDLTEDDIKFILAYKKDVDLEKFNLDKLEELKSKMKELINNNSEKIAKEEIDFNNNYGIVTEDDIEN